jgi:hypothetical protein
LSPSAIAYCIVAAAFLVGPRREAIAAATRSSSVRRVE